MQIVGQCHCGNLRFELTTQLSVDDLSIRACQCSFCRTHSAKSTSDLNGSVQFFIQNWENINRYQFDAKTADFLICKVCGVYLAAVTTIDGQQWAVVNLNTTSLRVASPFQYLTTVKHGRIGSNGDRIVGRPLNTAYDVERLRYNQDNADT